MKKVILGLVVIGMGMGAFADTTSSMSVGYGTLNDKTDVSASLGTSTSLADIYAINTDATLSVNGQNRLETSIEQAFTSMFSIEYGAGMESYIKTTSSADPSKQRNKTGEVYGKVGMDFMTFVPKIGINALEAYITMSGHSTKVGLDAKTEILPKLFMSADYGERHFTALSNYTNCERSFMVSLTHIF